MTDHLADVKIYDANADEAVVSKIVSHLGIALRNRDSALVSSSDPEELARVKTNWCGKSSVSQVPMPIRPWRTRLRR